MRDDTRDVNQLVTDVRPITISGALQLPAVRIGVPEVLAGHDQLERPIRWVHTSEYPAMSTVLKGGELLLTTGMGIPDTDRGAAKWVADLDDCGVAAVMVELGSAIDRVPRVVVEEAKRRSLPLVVLHEPIPFIEVTESAHRRILSDRTLVLEQAEVGSRHLASVLIDGGSTADVIETLSVLLGASVVLARTGGEIIFQASHQLRDAELVSLWESRRRGLEGAPAALWAPVRLGRDDNWGELAALSLETHLGAIEEVLLTRAAPYIAICLRRERETQVLAGRARGEFLQALAYGDQDLTEREAAVRAAALSFDQRTPLLLPVVITANKRRLGQDHWEQVAAELRRHFRRTGRPFLLGLRDGTDGLLLVVGIERDSQRAEIASAIGQMVICSAEEKGYAQGVLQVSVGEIAKTWRGLRGTLRNTLDSSTFARWRPSRPWHDVTAPDIPELLAPMRNTGVLRRFVEANLEPLRELDLQNGSELLNTLETYYAHGGRKADAARALHLERQSLYKRLTRISNALSADLDDEETQMTLQLALRAQRMVDPSE